MGGGSRKKRQSSAEQQSGAAAERERAQAESLRGELEKRRGLVGTGLPETMEAARTGAKELYETGGFRPEEINPVKESYGRFTETGGFSPEEKEQFLRRSTSPVTAVYSRAQDELKRRAAIQGGYMPGFDSSSARITRQSANTGAEASLGANVELARQVREGKLAGTSGLQRVAEATQRGRVAGQDALQRYSQFGVAALSDIDITELRNRLQTGQISHADAALLTQLAAQDRSLFENIMMGISTIGGATAGVLGAV